MCGFGFQSLVAHPCLVLVGPYFENATPKNRIFEITLGGGPCSTSQVKYSRLPGYFVAFDIFDRRAGRFLSRASFHTRLEKRQREYSKWGYSESVRIVKFEKQQLL